jgi:hypothetical protein
MTKRRTSLFSFSSAANPRSTGHPYNHRIEAGSLDQTNTVTEHLSCGLDLTDLKFVASSSPGKSTEDDDDTTSIEEEQQQQHSQQDDDTGDASSSTTFDVLVFPAPRWCASHEEACDLSHIGIGTRGPNGWTICDESTGTIQISNTYPGYHATIPVPNKNDDSGLPMSPHVKHGFVAPFERGGKVFTTIFANCGSNSRSVQVSGKIQTHCASMMSPTSMNGEEEYVPVPYGMVSVLVFLICSLCTFRIQWNRGQSGGGYQEAPQYDS